MEYIHLNPVRRGLVPRPEDWKWSSMGEFAGLSRGESASQRTDYASIAYRFPSMSMREYDTERLDAGSKAADPSRHEDL